MEKGKGEKIKIVLEFSGSGIKYFIYEILSEGTYNLMETVNIFKGGKIVEKFNNEEYLKSLLKLLYDSGELYIFISNGHIEAIREGIPEFNSTSKEILKIIKEMDEDNKYFKDLNIGEVSEGNDYFTEEEINTLETYHGDYSQIPSQHYYGPETEDRLEANAFATLYDSKKITVVQDKQYPYCLLFAGSTTIQVMKISKYENGESIIYNSETRPYTNFTKKRVEEEGEEGQEEEGQDKFFELLKGNKNVFFGSNFGWAFLYNEETSDVTMKKVELEEEGIIKKYVDGTNTEELYVKAGESPENTIARREKVTKKYEKNTYLTKLEEKEKEKEKEKERDLYIDYLIDYKNCSYYDVRCEKGSQSKPNCCFSTINEESFDGFLSFCTKIFHNPKEYFTITGEEPTYYFFRTVLVDGVEVEITASRGLIDYSEGKINIPLTGNEIQLSEITNEANPVVGSLKKPNYNKKKKKKKKKENKRVRTIKKKKRGTTKKKNPKKKKTSTRKKK